MDILSLMSVPKSYIKVEILYCFSSLSPENLYILSHFQPPLALHLHTRNDLAGPLCRNKTCCFSFRRLRTRFDYEFLLPIPAILNKI